MNMRVSVEDPDVVERRIRCVDKATGEVIYGVVWADTDTREVHRMVSVLHDNGNRTPVYAPEDSGEDWLMETVLMDFRIMAGYKQSEFLAETA